MKKKLNVRKLVIFIVLIIALCFLLTFTIKYVIKIFSFEYKLSNIGYNNEEINILLKTKDKEEKDYLLNNDYNEKLPFLFNEKYFMYKNLNIYLDNYSRNKKASYVVSVVNTKSYLDYYEETRDTDILKKDLMLVNRYNNLTKDYIPENLMDVDLKYAYSGVKIKDYVFDEYLKMYEEAKIMEYNFILFSGYRSYEDQEKAYNSIKADYGERKADEIAARAGYSEHQTGLVLEIGIIDKTFEGSDEQLWLLNNAHRYGFILRYEKEKEYITGFNYEPCHFRYVGVEAATKIYNQKITFDEYYTYYEEDKI